jgi:hypothetical protein
LESDGSKAETNDDLTGVSGAKKWISNSVSPDGLEGVTMILGKGCFSLSMVSAGSNGAPALRSCSLEAGFEYLAGIELMVLF